MPLLRGRIKGGALSGVAALFLALGAAGQAGAQTAFPPGGNIGTPVSPVLIIQPDKLFADSDFGRRVTRDIEADLSVLKAENRRIEAELRAEELELTERRKTIESPAFRALADAFDSKVQTTRAEQQAKFDAINKQFEAAETAFLRAAEPVLEQIMQETGASAILDRGSVFLAEPSADITNLAIARVNAVLGEGTPPDGTSGD